MPFDYDAFDADITSLGRVDVDTLDSDALAVHMARVEQAQIRLGAVGLQLARKFDESGVWANDAAYSAANWITARTGTSNADAGSRVWLAHRLPKMPLTSQALAEAEVTRDHARIMAQCTIARVYEQFVVHEPVLVEHAKTLPADKFAAVIQHWLALADPDGTEPADETGTASISMTDGHLKGTFDLTGQDALDVDSALNEEIDRLFRADKNDTEIDPTDPAARRTNAQRRAEAVANLIRRGATASCPDGVRKPLFTIELTPAMWISLLANLGRPDLDPVELAEVWGPYPLAFETVRRLLCDSQFARVITTPEGERLELGRSARTASPAQRRMLALRDRHCVVPGCRRPPNWCEAHHIKWWEDLGDTDIDNLCLLCSHHHHRVHGGHLEIRMIDRKPRVFFPDGRQVIDPRARTPEQVPAA